MFEIFLHPEAWISLITLTLLEVVLGIDNLVFISVITNRLPPAKQKAARQVGLLLACGMRLLLLTTIAWLTHFSQPLFTIFGQSLSVRDLVLIGGGLFLIAKSTSEIHVSVGGEEEESLKKTVKKISFTSVILQIMLLDIIFSLDSVITAVGMAREFIIMAIAIIIAVLMMILASAPLARLINNYPTIKMLALSFLLLIGVVLIADGFDFHVPRGYLYFAIAFSIFVEVMNIIAGRRSRPR